MTWDLWIPLEPMWLNKQRTQHWAVKGRETKLMRGAANMLARQQKIPALGQCHVVLTYYPHVKRRRDSDGLVATLKPLCDGLVDAGVVDDDTPDKMIREMPRIGEAIKECPYPSRLRLTIAQSVGTPVSDTARV